MTDPATMREAARQLREEADRIGEDEPEVAVALEHMARRFENEAKVAEVAAASTATADSIAADEVEHEGRIAMRWSEIIAKAEPRPFRAFRMGYHVARRFYEAKAAEKAKATEQATDCAAQEEAERRVHAAADRFERDVEAHMERVAKLRAKEEP